MFLDSKLAFELDSYFEQAASPMEVHPDVAAAAQYSLGAGGKRIRPALCIGAAKTITSSQCKDSTTVVAVTLELIHTYSLIHDDLPAMDDDDMRRGKPSLHKAFDEATAILVGDGLQARAFELIADAPDLSAEQKVCMIKVLAQAAGMEGMVGGQYIDIQAVDSDMTLDELQAMHEMKTGALIQASLALGGIAAGASDEQLEALDIYGRNIGLAFQVVDDILDVEGDPEALGKTAGKDAEANKPTYVKLLGLDGAKTEAARLLQAAIDALDMFGESADQLRELARYIVERDR
ncbi:polyprenyl synthetase family protein [Halioglobus maricola]|uniref:Polyprenyl synthetase family protein n=1 Tax=Halioglobus maricola TaxID=2601894 RepID=A0A5P9NI54_9GAMM|nr:farnesyl diphosphate synthase [Halioglobus maricola]QFU74678.1 polyprenyl synthetase family protein [Halioglobus maricola]